MPKIVVFVVTERCGGVDFVGNFSEPNEKQLFGYEEFCPGAVFLLWVFTVPVLQLNTGMAPTCDWIIKLVKVISYILLVSVVNRVSRSGTMKYQCENTDESNKKWLLT